MRAKKMLEKLVDLATFFTLAADNASNEAYKESRLQPHGGHAVFYEGKANAFNTAFNKVDGIIKEAKR